MDVDRNVVVAPARARFQDDAYVLAGDRAADTRRWEPHPGVNERQRADDECTRWVPGGIPCTKVRVRGRSAASVLGVLC